MMNQKENFLCALSGKKTEYIPWVPLIDRANTPSFVLEQIGEFWEELVVSRQIRSRLNCAILLGGSIVQQTMNGVTVTREQRDAEIWTQYSKNGHQLKTCTRIVVNQNQVSSAITEFLIKNTEDLKIWEDMLSNISFTIDSHNYETLYNAVGDEGIVSVSLPPTGIMQLIIHLIGCQEFIYQLVDEPDLVDRVIHRLDFLNNEKCRLTLDSGVPFEAVRVHDDHDVLLVTPDMFRKYISPSLKSYAKACHACGKLFIMHACGHVHEFLNFYPDTEMDAHHYLSTKPIGNVTLSETLSAWGGKITQMVSVDPILQVQGTSKQVRENVRNILTQVDPWHRFVLMSPLKPDIPTENIMAIREELDQWNNM